MRRGVSLTALTASLLLAGAWAQAESLESMASSARRLAMPDFKAPKIASLKDRAPARRTTASPRRFTGDLYYFTPAEAARAAKLFRTEAVRTGQSGFTFDSDVPPAIRDQMKADLSFISGIQGSNATPLHQRIFGPVSGSSYMSFFNKRVSAVGMNDCGSSFAVACVIPFEDPSKMWLTQNFIRFSHPQIARMMVVFHESRHTEIQHGNWPHAYCPEPFLDGNGQDMKSIWTGSLLAGQPACDETPLGSYGSSTIMLKNIQKYCTNCTDKVKMDAGLYADDQLNRITDPGAKRQMIADFAR